MLRQALRCQDERFLDFVGRCLTWDTGERMNPQEAMQHPWITDGPERSSSLSLKDAAMTVARKIGSGSTDDLSFTAGSFTRGVLRAGRDNMGISAGDGEPILNGSLGGGRMERMGVARVGYHGETSSSYSLNKV